MKKFLKNLMEFGIVLVCCYLTYLMFLSAPSLINKFLVAFCGGSLTKLIVQDFQSISTKKVEDEK